MAEDISLEELISGAMESSFRDFRVALPGRIDSYDASKQRASVRLELRYYRPDPDGELVAKDHPVLSNVPVAFPQGGGFFCSFPLAKGDPVTVVFCDVPIGAWLQKGSPCDPGHDELHGPGGAVAFPSGPNPSNAPLNSATGSAMRLGKDGTDAAQIELTSSEIHLGVGASEALALASKTKGDLDALKTAINGWTVVAQDGGAALKAALVALFTTPPGWPSSHAASNAKAKP
jgi:hypothetical protein